MYSLWFLRDAPDVLILVGSGRAVHQFAGHKTLLASHSGYLKAQIASDTTQISVPSIAPEVFAPLLTFMYTGYLDLTPDNIYAVLLATHLLHMPRALDLCRAYLVQSQQPAPAPPRMPTLVKPVPSRKPFPSLLPTPPYWAPPPFLPPEAPAPAPPLRPLFPPVVDTTTEDSVPDTGRHTPPAIPSTSTSTERQTSPPPSSLSPCLSQTSDASDQVTVTVPRVKHVGKGVGEGKVIVDVASCDGPVRFHRVLNQNYGKAKSSNSGAATGAGADKKAEEEEVYSCQYCEHTFKSHYCYQKHARRHLNPVPVKVKCSSGTSQAHAHVTAAAAKPKPARREVRLLDMNVQYYPCKTCGSKFPSYYFVHKHRKMCHPHEESGSSSGSGSGATTSRGGSTTATGPVVLGQEVAVASTA